MSAAVPQTLKNHARIDPPFHFFILPVFSIVLISSIVEAIRHFGYHSALMVIFYLAVLLLAFKVRLYALKVQTRVIRLEERLRLHELLPEPLRSRILELDESQLVALRFASDAECPALVEETLAKKLINADIKKAVREWRADYWRV
jgi:hypothetical protein